MHGDPEHRGIVGVCTCVGGGWEVCCERSELKIYAGFAGPDPDMGRLLASAARLVVWL